MSERRVAVTGLGLVTSLGLDVDTVFNDMLGGKSGITTITRFNTDDYSTKIGGEVTVWECPNLDKREAKRLDRFAQFSTNAAIDAVRDAGIDFAKEDIWRCGAIVGTGVGGMEEFATGHEKLLMKGPGRVSPFMVPKLMCNAGPGNISIYFGIKGPNSSVVTACASAAHSIAAAADAVRYGRADIMITGGSEAALTPLGLACFIALKALSKRNDNPAIASRPFDVNRDGFILSEGAGMLVLEDYEHAKARGANIYCEILGHGESADGSHITAPDEEGRGAAYAMTQALHDAKMNTDQVDYINAHGTSTSLGDLAETRGVKKTFGDDAYKLAVSSTKSMTGHTLGASGGIEAVLVAKMIKAGKVCPTINLDEPDEGCDLDYVPNTARDMDVNVAMSNSFGFGGHNISLVFGKV